MSSKNPLYPSPIKGLYKKNKPVSPFPQKNSIFKPFLKKQQIPLYKMDGLKKVYTGHIKTIYHFITTN